MLFVERQISDQLLIRAFSFTSYFRRFAFLSDFRRTSPSSDARLFADPGPRHTSRPSATSSSFNIVEFLTRCHAKFSIPDVLLIKDRRGHDPPTQGEPKCVISRCFRPVVL